jgi:hypothetical protein
VFSPRVGKIFQGREGGRKGAGKDMKKAGLLGRLFAEEGILITVVLF